MPRPHLLIVLALLGLLLPACTGRGESSTKAAAGSWRTILHERAKRYGHRNIIAVVDSAYPSQCKPGIELVATGASQLEVVEAVLQELAKHRHVRPHVMTDQELARVQEADAPGIQAYRTALAERLGALTAESLPHERIIANLDQAAQTFDVLLLKTDMTLPYTSVFIRLECGYWNDDAERRLRAAMGPG